MKPTRLLLATVLALASSCGSSGGTAGGSGKLTLLLKDAPGDVRAAVVTISEVDLVGDSGTVVLRSTSFTSDLLTLGDGATLVDSATVPPGTYHQLRFVITGGYLDVGGTIYASSPTYEGLPPGAIVGGELQMPSYAQSGLKVILPDQGLVIGDAAQTWVVDFDVSRSFGHGTGTDKWVMHPVVKATRVELTGTIAVTLALGPETLLPPNVTLGDFSATLTPAGGGDVTVLPLADLGNGTIGASFPLLPPGDYVVSFQAPAAISAFTTDPAVPAPVTAVSGQTTTQNFVLTDLTVAAPM
jgi:hypothetical protein